MSIWRDMTDPWPTEPPSSLPCPVCGGPVDYDARGLEEYKALRDELRALRREVAAWNAVARWLRGQEEVGLFVLDDGRFGVFFTGNISCAPDDWYPSIPALAAALGLEVEE